MKKYLIFLALALVGCSAKAQDNTLTKQEIKDGWTLLWDGKTTNGWISAKGDTFPAKGWHIADGLLVVEDGNGGEAANGGDIITEKEYKNFILSVDFKITEGANSGIKYFVQTGIESVGSSIGCEFQILDDLRHPDAKLGVNGNRTLASLYDLIPSQKEDAHFDINNFNTAKVVVQGNHVEHWLNGVKVVEYERNNQMFNALVQCSKYKVYPGFGNFEQGHILLQDHGHEVFYKNIKIKVLD